MENPARTGERRRDRDSFTRALGRIAERVSDQRVHAVGWTHYLVPGRHHSALRTRAMWVAGSYARGALTCGDLDLIVDLIAEEGCLPPERAISRVICGRAPDVRLYIGTPESNTSGASFPEAHLIWSDAAPDWRGAIAAITPDRNATRFARASDALPLRREQFAASDAEVHELIELERAAVLSWFFVPLDTIAQSASTGAAEYDLRFLVHRGRKTRDVMRYAVQYLAQRQPHWTWRAYWQDRSRFRCGGAEVFAGVPQLRVDLLDTISCSEVILAAHVTRRGPNGLWVIERGPQHPVRRLFADRMAYCLFRGGYPITVDMGNTYRVAQAIELFDAPEAARACADREKDEQAAVVLVAGDQLLQILSSVDIVLLPGGAYALALEGVSAIEAERITSACRLHWRAARAAGTPGDGAIE